MADRRAEWAKRVRQWRHSGQTARAFAASIGVKSGSLTHWAWRPLLEVSRRRHLRFRRRLEAMTGEPAHARPGVPVAAGV